MLDTLTTIGVEFAQGFFIAKPRPVAEFPGRSQGADLSELKLA